MELDMFLAYRTTYHLNAKEKTRGKKKTCAAECRCVVYPMRKAMMGGQLPSVLRGRGIWIHGVEEVAVLRCCAAVTKFMVFYVLCKHAKHCLAPCFGR